MMEERLELIRSGIVITLRCTLKCKLCGGYSPYYKVAPHYGIEELKKTISNYFDTIDYVGDFSVTGGEPLLHKGLPVVLQHIRKYERKIGRILLLTNGTMMLNEETIQVLKSSQKFHVTVSDYGHLSSKVDDITQKLSENGISYRVINYAGIDVFCDGWVDYGDHSLKHPTLEEREAKGASCAMRKRKVSIIVNGELHSCGRSLRRMELGIIPKNKEEYVDLNNEDTTRSYKRKIIRNMYEASSITSCAYCNGLCDDSIRYMPAEQIDLESEKNYDR